MSAKLELVDVTIKTHRDGQTVFCDVPMVVSQRVALYNEFIDADRECRSADKCGNCGRKVNGMNTITGNQTILQPRYIDGDESNHLRKNVAFLCFDCRKSLPKKKGLTATTEGSKL